MASGKGGYDCDFVDPPKRLECPICLQTVREPHVISCCGHQFCRLCIEQVRLQGRPCPLCNEPGFSLFLHKGVEREVKALRVRCPQKELGCEWVGELGGLERHVSPGAGPLASAGRDEGCQYVEVECVYQCGERHQRRFILQHETEFCTRRPVEAQLANVTRKLQEAREDNVSLREELVRMREQQLKQEKNHDEEMKNISEILCVILKATHVQVESDSPRKELMRVQGRLEDEQKKTRALSERLKEREKRERETVENLREGLIKMKAQQARQERAFMEKCDFLESRLTPTPPFLFIVDNFGHLKKHNIEWFSDPFYSNSQGYKLCVEVYPGGYGNSKGTHMSVYVCLMRGEYDDTLKWPFLGSVAIQLFHRPTELWRDVTVIAFEESDDIEHRRRPVGCTRNVGLGYHDFMSHTKLDEYIEEDGIGFRIAEVELQNFIFNEL